MASHLPPSLSAADTLSLAGDEIFRRLVESVHDYAIFMLTPEGIVASWNPGAQRIKGYTSDEAVGRHFSMFYRRGDVERGWPQHELRRAAEDGTFEDEGWRVRRDGTEMWANVVITAVRDDANRLLGFSKVTRDLTERRRQEEHLRQREEDFRLLVEGVRGHALFLLDTDGRIRSWNAGAQRLLGYTEAQVLGQPTSVLYTAEDRASGRFEASLARARTHGHLEFQAWRQHVDGQRLRVEVSTTELHDSDGRPRGFAQIIRDLSDKERVEALETEGRRISGFIAMLSHELRNPLAPIRNAVAILQRFAHEAETVWCADLIGRQVDHMTRLVDDLLDVSRVNSGKIRLELAPVALGRLVEEGVESLRPSLHRHGHVLGLQLPDGPLTVSGDATRLTQVLFNLVTNAGKYTPAPGRIDVTLAGDGDAAVLTVADTGIGLGPDLIDRVFDPFVQGERGLARSEGGLGLGLTLVRSVVELHGGSVVAASAGVGQGTTFTVRLPCIAAPVEAPPAIADAPVAEGPRARVLVVDDNEDAAETVAMLLRLGGHVVDVAHDADQALALAAAATPGIAFVDIGLPGMNGYELARRLRSTFGVAPTRLVAMTGYGQDKDKQAALDAGFDRHLTKPVDAAELVRIAAGHD